MEKIKWVTVGRFMMDSGQIYGSLANRRSLIIIAVYKMLRPTMPSGYFYGFKPNPLNALPFNYGGLECGCPMRPHTRTTDRNHRNDREYNSAFLDGSYHDDAWSWNYIMSYYSRENNMKWQEGRVWIPAPVHDDLQRSCRILHNEGQRYCVV